MIFKRSVRVTVFLVTCLKFICKKRSVKNTAVNKSKEVRRKIGKNIAANTTNKKKEKGAHLKKIWKKRSSKRWCHPMSWGKF